MVVMPRLEDSVLLDMPLDQEDADELYLVFPDVPRSSDEGCPTCYKNRGKIQDGVVSVRGVQMQCNCADQLQRYKHYLNAGIGLTYQRLYWDDYFGDPEAAKFVKNYIENLQRNQMEGRGFVAFGSPGQGKTMLAAFVLKEAVNLNIPCYMTTAYDFIQSTKKGWSDPTYAKWYKRKIDAARLLVLDDLGKEIEGFSNAKTDVMAIQQIENLIRVRTQQMRPTLITTNLKDLDMIKSTYNHFVTSLLTESCSFFWFSGDDARIRANEARRQERIY